MAKKSCKQDSGLRSKLPNKKDAKMDEAMKVMKKATKKPGGAMTRANYDD